MRHTRLRLFALFLSFIVAWGLATPATASTSGVPDTGKEPLYPNVVFLVSYSGGLPSGCTGTLVSPVVVLTAAHCADGVDGRVLVTFDPKPAPTRDDLPRLSEEAAPAGYQTAPAGYVTGTPHVYDPNYFTDLDSWNDFGVVVLDTPATGIDPAPLAPVGTLDDIQKSKLSKTHFVAVGYGAEVRKADDGSQRPTAFNYPVERRYVDVQGQKLTGQILQTNGSSTNGKGVGTTCFGDSGGPVFYNGQVVAVTSYAGNSSGNCRGISGYQRVDLAVVRDWLGREFAVTPAA